MASGRDKPPDLRLVDIDGKNRGPGGSGHARPVPHPRAFKPPPEATLDASSVPLHVDQPAPVVGTVVHAEKTWGIGRALIIATVIAGLGTALFVTKLDDAFGRLRSGANQFEHDWAKAARSVVDPSFHPTPHVGGVRTVYTALEKDEAVLVQIDVQPRNAVLLLDGDPLPSNPLRLPRGDRSYTISAMAEGFVGASSEVRPDRAQTLRLRLARAPK